MYEIMMAPFHLLKDDVEYGDHKNGKKDREWDAIFNIME
jgi:hypothetical protein